MDPTPPPAGSADFGVVVPFFQRRPGVLARTLRAIAAQTVDATVEVVVVDDASPLPAEPELAAVDWPAHVRARVIRQANGGPGAARNTGIAALAGVRWIAFVDSDDAWSTDHLACARAAFAHGFDFYAAPFAEGDGPPSTLERSFGEPVPLAPQPWASWAFALDAPLIDYTVRGPFVSSSTMVMDRALVGDTRFDTRLRTAGEDGLFKTALAARGPRVCVGTRLGARSGEGVHIFSDGDWGSRKAAERNLYQLWSRLLMRPLIAGRPHTRALWRPALHKARREAAAALLALWRREGWSALPHGLLRQLLQEAPALRWQLPADALRGLLGRR